MTFVASFLHGLLFKIILILSFLGYVSVKARFGGGEYVSISGLKAAYPNGVGDYDITKYIYALIAAPLLENLAFPLFVWAQIKLKFPMILGVLGLGILMYVLHGHGLGGITGGSLFILMFAQYLGTLKLYGKKSAYWFTVVTHFAFNLITFAIVFILNFMIGHF